MDFIEFSKKPGFFFLFLNSASSYALRDKYIFFIWNLNVSRQFFVILDVVAESEDDELIPSSILPVIDDLVSLEISLCIAGG